MSGKLLLAAAAVAACLSAASSASAADVPATTSTKATIGLGKVISGVFEKANDADWYKFTAQKGKNYQVQSGLLNYNSCETVQILDKNKKVVAKASCSTGIAPNPYQVAFEWIATYSGVYYVAPKQPAASTARYPNRYQLTIFDDCAPNTRTTCSTPVGEEYGGRFQYRDDYDYHAAQLVAGQVYYLTQDTGYISVRGLDGRYIASYYQYYSDGQQYEVFTAPYTGVYFVTHGTCCDAPDPFVQTIFYKYGLYYSPPTAVAATRANPVEQVALRRQAAKVAAK